MLDHTRQYNAVQKSCDLHAGITKATIYPHTFITKEGHEEMNIFCLNAAFTAYVPEYNTNYLEYNFILKSGT
jgi:hypothetical protein